MFQTLINAFKVKDIRKKIFLTLFLLLVFRLGSWLPIVGVNVELYKATFSGDGSNTLMGLLSAITGGALANGSLLALGISPYINASIIIQLLTVAIPPLERLSKEGEEGRKKISKITRYVTLVLALAQSIGIVVSWASGGESGQSYIMTDIFPAMNVTLAKWLIGSALVVLLVGGASFTMWLGEKITELGIGNGISLLIFIGILATAGQSIVAMFTNIFTGSDKAAESAWQLIGFLLLVVVIFAFIVFIDLSERRIPISYAKQVKGRKMMGGQSTYIPIKVNANGVLPIIFAMALVTFPQLIAQMVSPNGSTFLDWYNNWLGAGTWLYALISAVLIFGFSFFYAQIQFNPEDVSKNIQQYGGLVQGIRPGKPTAEYLGKINKRLTLFGAIFLAVIALIPSLLFSLLSANGALLNAFSATGMLIVVSVALEFDKQLQGQLMMKNYKGFLK